MMTTRGAGEAARRDVAFSAFYAEAYRSLLRTAYLLTGDTALAEDLVQTVLARLYQRWDRLDAVRADGALLAYARTALARQSISWWRRAWRAERPRAQVPEGRVDTAPDDVTRLDERDRMMRHLAQLTSRQRLVVVLRYLDDLSEADTAAALGCSVGSVKTHTHRGITRLRALLAEEATLDATALTPRRVTS